MKKAKKKWVRKLRMRRRKRQQIRREGIAKEERKDKIAKEEQ